MITKEQAQKLNESLKFGREVIYNQYELIHNKFKDLLRENMEFDCGEIDYDVEYKGCDFPIECTVEKIYLSEDGSTIFVELKNKDNEDDVFDVPITSLSTGTMYGDDLLNLYGQAIQYFTK